MEPQQASLFFSGGDVHWQVLSRESGHAAQRLMQAAHDGLRVLVAMDCYRPRLQ